MKQEYVDIVDDDDNVIGQETWEEMMNKSLLHRSSNVMIFNKRGRLFVHKRADRLMLYPGLFDVKVGGSVQAGESYEDAAKRELFEEVNIINVTIMELFNLKTRRKENNINRKVFKCTYDGKITLDRSEVEKGEFMEIPEVEKLYAEKKLSPSAIEVWEKYKKFIVNNP